VRLHGRNYKEWFQAENRNDHYKYPYKPKELEGWKTKDHPDGRTDGQNLRGHK
jgi:uncharacterized protein YecE (DUF72 family)